MHCRLMEQKVRLCDVIMCVWVSGVGCGGDECDGAGGCKLL